MELKREERVERNIIKILFNVREIEGKRKIKTQGE